MASIFDSMPNFQAFRNNNSGNGTPPPNPSANWNARVPFSSPATTDTSSSSSQGGSAAPGTDWNTRTPFSNPIDNSQTTMPTDTSMGNGTGTDSGNPSSSPGFFANLWNGILSGGKSALDFVNQKYDQVEHLTGLDHLKGALQGVADPIINQQTPINSLNLNGADKPLWQKLIGNALDVKRGFDFLQNPVSIIPSLIMNGTISKIPQSELQGFVNPDQMNQQFQGDLANKSLVANIGANIGTDPLSAAPVGEAVGLVGKALKAGSDAVGATPYLQSAADAVKSLRPVQALTQAAGKAFVPNYGASDGLAEGLQNLKGNIASDQMAIQQHLPQLAQAHGLTPDEIRQLPEVFEAKGSADPRLHQAYQDLNHLINNGLPLQDGFKLGTNAETTTHFNGNPILDPEKLIKSNGYYPQRYGKEMSPKLQQQMEQLTQGPNKGFSTSGAFTQERQFPTVAEAETNGFKPERNAYAAVGQRLAESSKSLRTAQFLQDMLDKGVFSKEQLPGMKASDIKPLGSYYTVVDGKPKVTSPQGFSDKSAESNMPATKLAGGNFANSTQAAAERLINPRLGNDAQYRPVNDILHELNNLPEVTPKYATSANRTTNYLSKEELQSNLDKSIQSVDDLYKQAEEYHAAQGIHEYPENAIFDSSSPFNSKLSELKQVVRNAERDLHNATEAPNTTPMQINTAEHNAYLKKTDALKQELSQATSATQMQDAAQKGNPWSAETAATHEDPNNFASLTKSMEGSNPSQNIVKVNPYYIHPADEAAIQEHLNPSGPAFGFGTANKLNNLFNKGFLLNPLPHMHNVTTNGMYLGEANPTYVKEAFSNLKNGASDPNYEQAVRAGAVSNLRGGNLMSSINNAMTPEKGLGGQLLDKLNYARHDALWDTDSAIRTSLFREAKESGMSDAAAAAHTNKFMVDYNNMTPFEKKYVKPIVPFYAWKKGNIPLQISQTFAQTPKYVAYQHAKDSVSQAMSGEPTDQKGRIMSGETLPDGSQVAIDPYSPMDEPLKIMDKGPVNWALGNINPIWKELASQGTSAIGTFFPKGANGVENKYSIYNAGAPAEYNARKGIAHAINSLDPVGGSSILGAIMSGVHAMNPNISANFNQAVNQGFGLPAKDAPGQTTSEFATKLLGGFTGRDNPAKDNVNQQYQQKDNAYGQYKYLKETGQSVPKSLQRQAFRRIKKAN